jgi:hypothetical protein
LPSVALAVPGIAQRAVALAQRKNLTKMRDSVGPLDAVSFFTKLGSRVAAFQRKFGLLA